MKLKKVEPNFWCSPEYFSVAGVKEELTPNGAIVPVADGMAIAPPIYPDGVMSSELDIPLWADVEGYANIAFPTLLDKEYIYDPLTFDNLAGKKWKPLRQKLNSFQRVIEGPIFLTDLQTIYPRNPMAQELSYEPYEAEHYGAVLDLVMSWLKGRGEIEDSDALTRYILNPPNAKVMIYHGVVVGVNIWDESWKYVNYRYVFALNEIPNLTWLMRYRFYTDPDIRSKNKLVNDGGVLDSPSLAFHKNKLNPVEVRQRYSWSIS